MLKKHGKRAASIRKRTLVMMAVALAVPFTALASASPAMAEPKGIFKIFNECPTEIPIVTLCSVDTTKSGEFAIGKTVVPINKNIVQQGGFAPIGESEVEFFGLPAKNGESLSKTELNVPGGLLDLINCEEITGSGFFETGARNLCKATFENEITGVTATTELVANEKNPVIFNEHNLATEKGTAIVLPVRIHLKNPFLGNACYIGSEKEPIELHLTTGASGSLHGKVGTEETLEEKGLVSLKITNNTLVDNTFAVPGAEGCGELLIFKGFLDGLVDSKLKIPNKAGENKAVFNGELRAAAASEVKESESF
jgi:hypothetical protein